MISVRDKMFLTETKKHLIELHKECEEVLEGAYPGSRYRLEKILLRDAALQKLIEVNKMLKGESII